MTKKAVILAGGPNQFNLNRPLALWPLINYSILEHLILSLSVAGFDHIIIALSDSPDKAYIQNHARKVIPSKTSVTFHWSMSHRGTAGSLKELEREIRDEDAFILMNGSIFLNGVKWDSLYRSHQDNGALITAVVCSNKKKDERLEGVRITPDWQIQEVYRPHFSMDRRNGYQLAGIYLLSKKILSYIPDTGYMDLKEQLIPKIAKEGRYGIAFNDFCSNPPQIESIEDYFLLHRTLLHNENFVNSLKKEFKEVMDGVWIENEVELSPNAYVLGPVVLRKGSRIEDFAQIIGPSVIGNNCHISKGALVRESVLWDNVKLSSNTKLQYSVLTNEAISNIKNIPVSFNTLMTSNKVDVRNTFFISRFDSNWTYKIGKRIIDIVLGVICILFFLPLFFLISLAIKSDSSGPVLFFQKRCGRDGKEFCMFKFRTMVKNAEKLQKEVSPRNEVDGPMFKVSNDPRVTRVGRFLRKSSLDELPQLFNVLKGEMSFVGPRPLKMEEMAFCPSWRDLRLRVKPGITGLWQVSGKSLVSFNKWIYYDVEYIKNQSLGLDIKILYKTLRVVWKGQGAT
ncbi:MAG: sugar transferase [Nitrospirae bacterium]|nr:sugar transferase [Nitrospirota bacterium]